MFGWFKKQNTLHGFDLDQWHYLGKTEIRYVNKEDVVTERADVFFFLNKTTAERKYTIPAGSIWNTHNMVIGRIQLWRIGEIALFSIIHQPSSWLKQYVWEKHQCVWSDEKSWWVSNDNTQYQAAVEAQKNQSKSSNDAKVVEVDFSRKN